MLDVLGQGYDRIDHRVESAKFHTGCLVYIKSKRFVFGLVHVGRGDFLPPFFQETGQPLNNFNDVPFLGFVLPERNQGCIKAGRLQSLLEFVEFALVLIKCVSLYLGTGIECFDDVADSVLDYITTHQMNPDKRLAPALALPKLLQSAYGADDYFPGMAAVGNPKNRRGIVFIRHLGNIGDRNGELLGLVIEFEVLSQIGDTSVLEVKGLRSSFNSR